MKPRPDLVVWIDGDSFWLRGTFDRIVRAAHEMQAAVGGWIGWQVEMGTLIIPVHADGTSLTTNHMGGSELIPCRHLSPGMVAMPTWYLDRIGDDPWTPDAFEAPSDPYEAVARFWDTSSEDLQFMHRLFEAGLPMYLDGRAPVWQALKGYLFLPGQRASHLNMSDGLLSHAVNETVGKTLGIERAARGMRALYGTDFSLSFRDRFTKIVEVGGPTFFRQLDGIAKAFKSDQHMSAYCAVHVLERRSERVTVNRVASFVRTSLSRAHLLLAGLVRGGFVCVKDGSLATSWRG